MNKLTIIFRSLLVVVVLSGALTACSEKEQVTPKKVEKLPNGPVQDNDGRVRPG
jgi:uncharacterized lipoprotein YehR (DUF1307 family)